MSLYVDSSAFLKLYVEEPESDVCEALLRSDPGWMTARITLVEVRRNLSTLLDGRDLAAARRFFGGDWASVDVIDLTEEVCEAAAEIAEATKARSVDAVHLGSAQVAGAGSVPLVTFDRRQAEAARSLGWTVLGS